MSTARPLSTERSSSPSADSHSEKLAQRADVAESPRTAEDRAGPLSAPRDFPFDPLAPLPSSSSCYGNPPEEWSTDFAQDWMERILHNEYVNPGGYALSETEARGLFDSTADERAAVDRARGEFAAINADWRSEAIRENLTLPGSTSFPIEAELRFEAARILGPTGQADRKNPEFCRVTITTSSMVNGRRRFVMYWADAHRFLGLYQSLASLIKIQDALHLKLRGLIFELARNAGSGK